METLHNFSRFSENYFGLIFARAEHPATGSDMTTKMPNKSLVTGRDCGFKALLSCLSKLIRQVHVIEITLTTCTLTNRKARDSSNGDPSGKRQFQVAGDYARPRRRFHLVFSNGYEVSKWSAI